ncbi:unnamed protein product [Acanthoscelides obtectus]|uniref:Uncharacterized protein n=1 Tax=Acanthoscelides obtectus TaxID=200917 RepID=A0A9P0QBF0_ACAOB|nr:unnamed protein product [Acanthoscelides obtectus]CAK1672299.1 hypothetical protein AOBTE_LOCUS28765 [Acanthoscelides obtectus]
MSNNIKKLKNFCLLQQYDSSVRFVDQTQGGLYYTHLRQTFERNRNKKKEWKELFRWKNLLILVDKTITVL